MSNGRQLEGQTVLVIGGSSGIGLETARQAREEGASVIITARDPDRLHRAGLELGASIAAFDATDSERLGRFFAEVPEPIDHLLLPGGGASLRALRRVGSRDGAPRLDAHLLLPLAGRPQRGGQDAPQGALLLIGGTGGRAPAAGPVITAVTTALPALTRSLALELAPVRVNLIAPGFVDTPLSARILGDQLGARRDQLRATLPIGRVVAPTDVAALAIHLMTNTAVTGATFDIDGGQQLLA